MTAREKVLLCLAGASAGLTASEVHYMTGLKRPTVSARIAELCQDGTVRRISLQPVKGGKWVTVYQAEATYRKIKDAAEAKAGASVMTACTPAPKRWSPRWLIRAIRGCFVFSRT